MVKRGSHLSGLHSKKLACWRISIAYIENKVLKLKPREFCILGQPDARKILLVLLAEIQELVKIGQGMRHTVAVIVLPSVYIPRRQNAPY